MSLKSYCILNKLPLLIIITMQNYLQALNTYGESSSLILCSLWCVEMTGHIVGLLPDTLNCGLGMRRECRERFPRHRLQSKPLVSDSGMHHGMCMTHVPWCMSGSLAHGGGENVPSIPGACATHNFTYLVRGPWPECRIRLFARCAIFLSPSFLIILSLKNTYQIYSVACIDGYVYWCGYLSCKIWALCCQLMNFSLINFANICTLRYYHN